MISIFFLFVFSLLLLQVTSNYMKKEKKINAIMTNYLWNNEVTYMALETVLENLEDIDKVYIICPFTDKAKKKYQNRFGKRLVFFDETSFPFQSQDIFDYMMEVVKVHGVYPLEGVTPFEKFLYVKIGWFLQQLLKLYAGRVIGLEDYLVLDADVFWFNKVNFINETIGNMTRYNYASSSQYHQSYMASIGKLSGDEIYYKEKETFRGGITHHMVFTKHVLNSIFEKTEKKHKLPFWKAVLNVSALEITCHAPRLSLCGSGSTLSEYDLYLNHAKLYYPETINYRPLLWTNGPSPGELFWPPLPDPKLHTDRAKPNWLGHKSEEVIGAMKKQLAADKLAGFDYIGYHSYARRRYYEMVYEDCETICGPQPIIISPNTTCSWRGFDERSDISITDIDWFKNCACYMLFNP